MNSEIQHVRRFDWVLKGLHRGPRVPFDRDLFAYDEVAVSPTVGAITAGWLLVIPRISACCTADLPSLSRRRVIAIADEVRDAMDVFPGSTFLFEHGARKVGSVTGCGVDQAHIHLANLEGDFIQSVLSRDPNSRWIQVDESDPWNGIDANREYYLVSDFSRAFVSFSIAGKSQYFRRVFAEELSRPTEWDYRLFANERNARTTVRLLDARYRRRSVA